MHRWGCTFMFRFVALFVLTAISIPEKNKLIKFLLILFLFSILLLSLVPFFGVEIKGAKRWIDGFILPRFQPIELVKPLFILFVAQTIILTRTAMKASQMPIGEDLDTLGKSGATLAIHLSIRNLKYVCETLVPYYGIKCPVAVIYRASWPDQMVIRGTLGDIRPKVRAAKITRTALIIVGKVLSDEEFKNSSLYDPAHTHLMRPNRTS